ncbi:MAG TPA: radical SAM protein [Candidatus Obscuribacterales bacterium]
MKIYQNLGKSLTAVEPPVWAGLMATYIRNKGFRPAILDTEAEMMDPEAAARRIVEMKPKLAAIVVYGHQPSASTQNMTGASAIATAIKALAPDLPLIMVGGHVAALPERTMAEENVDFVAQGEGLETLHDLLLALDQPEPDFSQVPDLWYRKQGKAVRSLKFAPLFKALNEEMPNVAWDLLPMDKYRAHNWHTFGHLNREPYAAIYTTLGCPYKCSFCCIQAPFKSGESMLGYSEKVNSYRFWSPDNVIAQIDTLVKDYGVSNIKIADEMFVLNARHINGICDRIIERGYKLNIWAYARVDTVKTEMLDKLKQAGVNWLALGIESASATVRDGVDKGYSQELIFDTVRKIQAAGINVIGNYIFGLPDDNLATMQETLDMALELNCEMANFYCAMAYPGSQLYEQAVRENWPLPETWSGYSQHAFDSLPLPTHHLSGGEVLKFRDEAFHTYFSSEGYLSMVEDRFGAETREHIESFTKYRLPRKYIAAEVKS